MACCFSTAPLSDVLGCVVDGRSSHGSREVTVVPRVHVAGAFLSSVTRCGFAERRLSAPYPTSFGAGATTMCYVLSVPSPVTSLAWLNLPGA